MNLWENAAIAVCLLIAAIILSLITTKAQKSFILVALAVPQIYVGSLAGFLLPVAVLLALVFLPSALLTTVYSRDRESILLVLFLVTLVASIAWSQDKTLGTRNVLFIAPVASTFLLWRATIRERGDDALLPGVRVFAFFALAQALLVILFRLAPTVEESFLKSTVATIFANRSSLAGLYGAAPNNVLDTAKAGGVFVNANVAAAFLGVSAFALFAVASRYRSKRLRLVGWFLLFSVLFTGSEMGAALAISVPIVVLILTSGRDAATRIVLFAALIMPLLYFVLSGTLDVVAGKEESAQGRLLVWRFAAEQFISQPLLGLGNGGWQTAFPSYAATVGIDPTFPPHSSPIYLWAQAGLVAVLAAAALVGLALRQLWWSSQQPSPLPAACTFGSLLWLILHSTIENFGVLGEEHMQPIVGAMLAYSLTSLDRHQVDETLNV